MAIMAFDQPLRSTHRPDATYDRVAKIPHSSLRLGPLYLPLKWPAPGLPWGARGPRRLPSSSRRPWAPFCACLSSEVGSAGSVGRPGASQPQRETRRLCLLSPLVRGFKTRPTTNEAAVVATIWGRQCLAPDARLCDRPPQACWARVQPPHRSKIRRQARIGGLAPA